MQEKKEYMELARVAVEFGKKSGADAAEAFIADTVAAEVKVSGRKVEEVNAVREAGVGLRLLKDQKLAFGSTNELSEKAVRSLIGDLMKKVVFHTPDEFNVIAGKESESLEGMWSGYSDLITYDPQIAGVPIQEKIQRAIQMEAAALDFSSKVSGTMFALYQDSSSYFYLANSNGLSGWFPQASCGGVIQVSAAEGEDHQSGTFSQVKAKYADFDPDTVGKTAAENAVKMLGARPIPSCEIPMVVSPEVGTQLFAYLAGMLSADEIQKGKSLFAGKLETQVAASAFHLIDDGKLKGGLATSPVDGEGVPQQTTPLIQGGVLKNFLYDSYTAKKGKTKSTGNRSRGSYSSPGGIGPSNLYLRQGGIKREDMISAIDRGFFLTVAFGLHAGIDGTSGDFSIPVAGFMIEKGQITYPVRGINIGGNLFELLKAVDKIGNDLTWFQSLASPTFLVASVKIGGVAG
jgi:PmbA protein